MHLLNLLQGYAGYPLLPGFTGGNGQIGIVHYSKSPIGCYNEIMYGPGNYAPGCGAASPLNSVQRIWVDNVYSQAAGRNIWGIPKVIRRRDESLRASLKQTASTNFKATAPQWAEAGAQLKSLHLAAASTSYYMLLKRTYRAAN